MKEQKNKIQNPNVKELAKRIVNKAHQRNLIKPVSEAFKDIPAKNEIHKGKEEGFL